MKLSEQLDKLSKFYLHNTNVDEYYKKNDNGEESRNKYNAAKLYFGRDGKEIMGKTGWLKLPDDVKCSNNVTPAIYINNQYRNGGLMEGIFKNNSDLKDANFSATNIFMNPFPCIKRNYGGYDYITGEESTEQYVYPNFEKRMSYFHGRGDLEHGKIKKDSDGKLVRTERFTDYNLKKRDLGAGYIASVSLLILFLIYSYNNKIK